jgi:phosphoribosylaminoimidazole-succinocarboxamide synthase
MDEPELLAGEVLAEGKTKLIRSGRLLGDQSQCVIEAKDDITAGDGKRHERLPGKSAFCTTVTANVFAALRCRGVPVAYEHQRGERQFVARRCRMVPLEVVVRRCSLGSYRTRNPEAPAELTEPLVECFLKTTGRRFATYELGVNDPLVLLDSEAEDTLLAYRPDRPIAWQPEPLAAIPASTLLPLWGNSYGRVIGDLQRVALHAFTCLEALWSQRGCIVQDCKFELGITFTDQELVVADVLDPDSWRLLDQHGEHLDKQPFRDGEELSETAERYQRAAQLSCQFFGST